MSRWRTRDTRRWQFPVLFIRFLPAGAASRCGRPVATSLLRRCVTQSIASWGERSITMTSRIVAVYRAGRLIPLLPESIAARHCKHRSARTPSTRWDLVHQVATEWRETTRPKSFRRRGVGTCLDDLSCPKFCLSSQAGIAVAEFELSAAYNLIRMCQKTIANSCKKKSTKEIDWARV